jgi:hypothetical protein
VHAHTKKLSSFSLTLCAVRLEFPATPEPR